MSASHITQQLDTLIALTQQIPSISSQSTYKVPTKSAKLYQPNLGNIISVIQEGLQSNFKNAAVEIVKCPDLRQWADLSAEGICGNTRLIDAGGVPFMFDPELQSKASYDMKELVRLCGLNQALVIGAGAGNPKIIGKNAELIPNIKLPDGPNHTHFTKMIASEHNNIKHENDGNDTAVCRLYNASSCGCLCNLFVSDGKCGDNVIHITAKGRTGKVNFTNCIRESLQRVKGVGGDKQIGMGGVIKVKNGKIKGHVMPDFLEEKLDVMDPKQDIVDRWLYFYECGPNLVMMTTMISGDPTENNSLHLRVEHTHFYTLNKGVNEGGHYHYDTTPDDIEYEAYLNTAEYIYRIEDAFQYNMDKSRGSKHSFDASLIK